MAVMMAPAVHYPHDIQVYLEHLISSSGFLAFRNSKVFKRAHLYFLMR
jgi:hypothetical protein